MTTPVLLCPLSSKIDSYPRTGRLGGGVALLYKDGVPVKVATNYDYYNMEYTDFLVSPQNSVPIHLGLVYRPLHTIVLEFGEDLADYMEKYITSTGKLVLSGDFNIHINDKSN